jgi:hypothetical protein
MIDPIDQANKIDAAIKSIADSLNRLELTYLTNAILVKVIPTENPQCPWNIVPPASS